VKWDAARDNQPSTDPEDIGARDRLVYAFHHLAPDSITKGTFDFDLDGTAEETHADWANTLDWLGIQYYMRAGVTGKGGLIPVLALTPCFANVDVGSCLPPMDPTYCVPSMLYETYPLGLHEILMDFEDRYPTVPLVVSEAGIATDVGARRAENVVRILEEIVRARTDGADVRGYYHWSLYDNFEWNLGFLPHFGLYSVDYGGSYDRSPTTGAEVLSEIAKSRLLSDVQVDRYGGGGPMTPEGVPPASGRCNTP
jgi:beta-glucosidase